MIRDEQLLCGCRTTRDNKNGLVYAVQTCEWCNTLRLGTINAVMVREGREAEAERHVSKTERGRMPDPLHFADSEEGNGLWHTEGS